ncbi:BLUF domain-containing protein [Aliiglaciecola sp. M165]|uniref:BLUF domain-containing protein n=1 Tax=Aliiglaciecola sp. M165 TaxID=2593649 RepID=UPI00117D4AD6|nr:BLUF domain-containing protein [Aliiglaciecola sp. M165]TRY32876.1 BLUF domain-containing protein [Aliiglaciecola sp. M165]
MVQLIYTSVATKHMDTEQLFDMLIQCRLNNRRKNLTGILLYCNKRFIQVLEGPEENVEALYEKILRDPLHKHCRVLCKNTVAERAFKEWEMGFKRLSSLDFGAFRGYSKFFEQEDASLNETEFHDKVLAYLTQFKDVNVTS